MLALLLLMFKAPTDRILYLHKIGKVGYILSGSNINECCGCFLKEKKTVSRLGESDHFSSSGSRTKEKPAIQGEGRRNKHKLRALTNKDPLPPNRPFAS